MSEKSEYTKFVEKFKPKLTTDDCFTPPPIYEAVLNWTIKEYGLKKFELKRPFKPLGDYKAESYCENSIVIDNPPFSILSDILKYYDSNGIKYLLFAPALTVMNYYAKNRQILITNASVTYENGAVVNTAFVTNLGTGVKVCGKLTKALKEANRQRPSKKKISYTYPHNVLTSASLMKLARRGVEIEIKESDLHFTRALDSQRAKKKAIFGAGLLCSDQIAEIIEQAENKYGCERSENADHVWKLSDRELEIIESLSKE